MARRRLLDADDFPLQVEQAIVKTRKGEPVATAESAEIAEEIALRLNEDALRRHEENWKL